MSNHQNPFKIGVSYGLPNDVFSLNGQQAIALSRHSHHLIELYGSYAYEYVIPAIWEFDDLVFFHNKRLSDKTIRIVDQCSGKNIAFRSDNTLQILRMYGSDCKMFPKRLCYANDVFHQPNNDSHSTRHPFQVGVEFLGTQGDMPTLESIALVIQTCHYFNLNHYRLCLNHSKWLIYMAKWLRFDATQTKNFIYAVQNCNYDMAAELSDALVDHPLLKTFNATDFFQHLFLQNITLNELEYFENICSDSNELLEIINYFKRIFHFLNDVNLLNICDVFVSFSQNSGYSYYDGLVFWVYQMEHAVPLLQGGEYSFQSHQKSSNLTSFQAVGFSLDLLKWLDYSPLLPSDLKKVFVPFSLIKESFEYCQILRKEGFIVIYALSQTDNASNYKCTQILKLQKENWEITDI